MCQILKYLHTITCLARNTILGSKYYQYPHTRQLMFSGLAKGTEFPNYGTETESRYQHTKFPLSKLHITDISRGHFLRIGCF